MRNKCIQMLLSALQSKELPDGTHDPEELAIKIEKKLFEVSLLSIAFTKENLTRS